MKSLHFLTKSCRRFVTASICLSVLLTGCGGGNTSDVVDGEIQPAVTTDLRALPTAFTTQKSVAYSPFVTSNRATETITDAQVQTDLNLLVSAGFGVIRLFDSSDKVALRTLRVIRANSINLKVMLGVYVNSFEYQTNSATRLGIQQANDDEIARGVALANEYRNEVIAVSVGNETMPIWSVVPISTTTLAQYIKTVRDQITQPVTTDDNWAYYAGKARNANDQVNDILRQIDFASIHTYAYADATYSNFSDNDSLPDWDWQQKGVTDLSKRATAMMDAAIAKTKQDYNAVRAYLDTMGRSSMPIIIGETGWKAANSGASIDALMAHPVNQKMFYARLLDWALESRTSNGPKGIVYFEAFDEPWKQGDDKWGLFTVDREARCTIQSLNPNLTADTSASCADTAAVYYKPPTLTAAVSTASLVVHNESTTGWPTDMRADPYQGGTFNLSYPKMGDSAASDMAANLASSHYIELNTFTPAGYGWGLLWYSSASPEVPANMSLFADGSIKFSINTAYLGKLRIGISSDTDTDTRQRQEAFVLVSDGQYGYCRTGTSWCDVTIPVSAFTANNPLLDLRYVLIRFSISDVYSATGNDGTGQTTIKLDNIRWSR
jgi:Glycosyl hydrolases family 17